MTNKATPEQQEMLENLDLTNTQINEEVIEDFTMGLCVYLAFTLNKRYGWTIYHEFESDNEHPYDPYCHMHSWVKNPDGNAVDINGIHEGNYAKVYEDDEFTEEGVYTDATAQLPSVKNLENPNEVDLKILDWAERIINANPEHFGIEQQTNRNGLH